jgi:hypothetical protein
MLGNGFCHLEGANLAGCRGWAGREFKAGFSDSVIAILQYFVHVAISKDSWGGVFLSQLVPRVLVCKSVSRGGSPSESENPPSRREHTFRLDSSGIARHATFACSRYLSILLDGPRLSALCIFGEVSKNLYNPEESNPGRPPTMLNNHHCLLALLTRTNEIQKTPGTNSCPEWSKKPTQSVTVWNVSMKPSKHRPSD